MRVPTALPFVFTALKVASVLAMIGAIVGEYFGGSFNALGVLIRSDAQVFHFETAWAGILVASLLGIALYLAVAVDRARRRALGAGDAGLVIQRFSVHNRRRTRSKKGERA